MSTTHTLVLLSVLLAVVVVAVLAAALIEVRRRLHSVSANLATLADALVTVEEEHLRPLEPAVKAINAQFDVILTALPGIARKAAVVAERRPR
jgi:cob(I)alamin adenosyltransferase